MVSQRGSVSHYISILPGSRAGYSSPKKSLKYRQSACHGPDPVPALYKAFHIPRGKAAEVADGGWPAALTLA